MSVYTKEQYDAMVAEVEEKKRLQIEREEKKELERKNRNKHILSSLYEWQEENDIYCWEKPGVEFPNHEVKIHTNQLWVYDSEMGCNISVTAEEFNVLHFWVEGQHLYRIEIKREA